MKVRTLIAMAISGLFAASLAYAAVPNVKPAAADPNSNMNEINDNSGLSNPTQSQSPIAKQMAGVDDNSGLLDPSQPPSVKQQMAADEGAAPVDAMPATDTMAATDAVQAPVTDGNLAAVQPLATDNSGSMDMADNSGLSNNEMQNTDQNNFGSMSNASASADNSNSNDDMSADTATGDDDY